MTNPSSNRARDIAALNTAFKTAGLEDVVARVPCEKNASDDVIDVHYPMHADQGAIRRSISRVIIDGSVQLKPKQL